MRIYYHPFFDEYHLRVNDSIATVFCPWMWKRLDFYLAIFLNISRELVRGGLMWCIYYSFIYQSPSFLGFVALFLISLKGNK